MLGVRSHFSNTQTVLLYARATMISFYIIPLAPSSLSLFSLFPSRSLRAKLFAMAVMTMTMTMAAMNSPHAEARQ